MIWFGLAPIDIAYAHVSMYGIYFYSLIFMASYTFYEILFKLLKFVSSNVFKDYWFHFFIEYDIMSYGVIILCAAGDRSSNEQAT